MSKYNIIFSYLKKLFSNTDTELSYNNEFQLIMAVILSAQTTDIQVNKVTSKIFNKIKVPQDIITIWQSKLERSISSINYYKTKSKHLFRLAQHLIDKKGLNELWIKKINSYQGENNAYFIPTTIKDLQKLPWIGEKTAKVIAHVLFQLPVIAVDTHVHRVCNRLWIVSTKTAEQTSKLLEKRIPKQYKPIAHHSLILFWRYYCTARNPKCTTSELQKICKWYNQNY